MTASGYCPNCHRTVYVDAGAETVCPVCSTPLTDEADAAGPELDGRGEVSGGDEETVLDR